MTPETEQRLRALEPRYFERLPYFECGDGWAGLIEEVVRTLKKRRIKGIRFVQIKEKIGQLRLYTNRVRPSYANWWFTYEAEIETRSGSVCEECGAPGKREREGGKAHGWIRALCPTHTTVGILARQVKLEAVAQVAKSALGVLEKDRMNARISSMSVDVLVQMLRRTLKDLEETP